MRIATLDDATALLAPIFAPATVERVAVVHLAASKALIGLTLEAVGEHGEVPLPIGAILRSALLLGGEALIVAHNHPSGDPEPSAADREATRRLADALSPLGLRLLDHIVFARNESCSMAAMGLV